MGHCRRFGQTMPRRSTLLHYVVDYIKFRKLILEYQVLLLKHAVRFTLQSIAHYDEFPDPSSHATLCGGASAEVLHKQQYLTRC